MKRIILISAAIFAYCILHTAYCFSQGTAINNSGAAADGSAMLDVSSASKGMLVPRMLKTEKLAISNPANGLLIYQTDDTTGFWYFNSVKWVQAVGPSGAAGATGPTGQSGASQSCPSGFTSANAQYCIETNERSSATWIAASNACMNAGARLCSLDEWYSACSSVAGLNGMTNGWEWTSESGGSNGVTKVGSGSCSNMDMENPTAVSYSYRCCFSRGAGPAGATGPTGPSGQVVSKRAFVTSTMYDGNLGGLSGADNICIARANAAGIGGNWMAWLSTSTMNAKNRSTYSDYYVNMNGDIISNNGWKGLIGSILSEIRWDEFGNYISNSSPSIWVWTGTEYDGTDYGVNCSDWTSASSSVDGGIGMISRNDSQWSEYSQTGCANNQRRIYCFEQ